MADLPARRGISLRDLWVGREREGEGDDSTPTVLRDFIVSVDAIVVHAGVRGFFCCLSCGAGARWR